jgi:hypothetical protein
MVDFQLHTLMNKNLDGAIDSISRRKSPQYFLSKQQKVKLVSWSKGSAFCLVKGIDFSHMNNEVSR